MFGIRFIHLLSVLAFVNPNVLDDVEATFNPYVVIQSLSEAIEFAQLNKETLAANCSCAYHVCSNILENTHCTERLGYLDDCGPECSTRKVNFAKVLRPTFLLSRSL